MDTRASTRSRLSVLPVFIALVLNLVLPLAPVSPVAAADGIANYSQCQIGNPSSGLDCENWINGILNATHNNYSEDEVVPQRLIIDFDDTGSHYVTLSYMARKTSGGKAAHAYDYLATWNHTYINADRCQDLGNPALCVGGTPDFFDIPSDPTSVTPGGPQPTSAHELPQANRQFVMYGGDITSTSPITHTTDPAEEGSDYGNITIHFNVSDPDGRVMLLFGGHLAAGFGDRGWGAGLGAAGISGGPYHIRVTAMDGGSVGNRDNQIMSDAIEPLPGLEIAKTTTTPVISAGDTASYTVTITNSGQGDATGVVLSDSLPAGIVWSETPDNASCTISGGTSLSCGPLTVAAASSFSVTVTGTTDAADCPSILNRATFTSTNGGSGASAPEGQGTQITINCPTIRVEKTPDEDTGDQGANDVNVGSPAVFTITVFNDGAGIASGVAVFDDLPGTGWSVVGGASTTLAGCAVSDPADGEHADKGEILSCGPDTIAASSSKKVTVTKTTVTADCGEIDNTASASATNNGSDIDLGNVDVRCPSVRVEKTPDENEQDPTANDVSAGDAAAFTVTVFNDGTAPATNVNLFDDLPGAGWSVVGAETTLTDCQVTDPADGDHAEKGEILSCGPDTIDASASKKVTVTKTTDTAECGEIDNTASVTVGNAAGDSDSGNIDVLCPSVSVEKTPDDGTVDAPGTATFTIVATNSGTGIARDAEIFDDLPEVAGGWNLGSVAGGETAWQSCEVTDDLHGVLGDIGEWLKCGPEDIEGGGDRTVVVTAAVTTADCGSLPNAADLLVSNGAGDEDAGLITVQCPDLDITKTADADVVDAGDDIGFSITVANSDAAGTGDAVNVTLDDPLPGSLALGVDWSIDAVLLNGVAVVDQTLCSITGSPATETLECSFGTLEPGDDYEVQLSSGTSAPTGCETADLFNEAAADADNHAEIKADDTITVQCPDLDITKTADADVVDAGDDIGFSITVANSDAAGTGDAVNVTLDDPLPGSLALGVDWSIDAVLLNGVAVVDQTLCSITGSPATETLECGFGTLEPGDDYEVQLSSGTAAPTGCETADLFNEAAAEADNHAEIKADDTITVQCPDLDITKTADADVVSAGEQIGFTVTVANSDASGTGTAMEVSLEDELPGGDGIDWGVAGVSINGVAASEPGDWCSISGAPPTEELDCDFDDLGPGDSASVHVTSGTTAASCATYDNTAVADALNAAEVTSLEATVTVECPGLNLVKQADADPIDAGEEASFTITLWNNGGESGNADAFDVELHDDLPEGLTWDFEIVSGDAAEDDCMLASSVIDGGEIHMSIDCDFGTLEPTSMAGGIVIRVFADTARADCGVLENTAEADGSNLGEPLTSSDSIVVKCPTITLDKENDAVGSVLPGTTVTYALTVTVDDGPAEDVTVVDELPMGLQDPTEISDGGLFGDAAGTITWNLGDLADGEYTVTYRAVVANNVENGDELVNAAFATSTNSQCPDAETLGPECEDDSTILVRVPTLVIDKVASTDTIVITGPNDALVATPSVVTWTLSYTLTNGPVTNAVITDPVPAGFTFLDASDGGTFADGTVTWELGTLATSGSVTFRTTVNPATISRVAPTVNVATIDSNETAPDTGQDSVTVSVEAPPLAGTPTPKPSLPNTASGIGLDGTPVTVPIELLAAFFIASLGALALANVKARSRRR